MQGCREAGKQGGREVGRQGGRDARRQGNRDAGMKGGREAERYCLYYRTSCVCCQHNCLSPEQCVLQVACRSVIT
jgi:hypothetical protein